jgi:hypothetical protein
MPGLGEWSLSSYFKPAKAAGAWLLPGIERVL